MDSKSKFAPRNPHKGPVFPSHRAQIKRAAHTTPDRCLAHEYYLDFRDITQNTRKYFSRYRCRYCGNSFDFIDPLDQRGKP